MGWEPGGSEGSSHLQPGADSLSTLLGCPGNPAGVTEEMQARPERAQNGPLEPQILQDNPTLSLAEALQVSLSLPSKKYIHTPHHPE